MIRGTAVSAGVALGTAYVLACSDRSAAARRTIARSEIEIELGRLQTALDKAEQELSSLKKTVADKIGTKEADIFAAQALVLKDAAFKSQVSTLIEQKQINVEAALAEVVEKFTHAFDKIPDAYLRERAADIRDVGRRVLSALIVEQAPETIVPHGAIVVAEELLPSLTARLGLEQALAIVTEHGGKFSHMSILARSQGTPAVSGVADAATRIKTGDRLIVDGISGVVFVNPPEAIEREYARLEREIHAQKEELRQVAELPALTRDGASIGLLANVSKLADTEAALLYRAEGIGLYRTEFAFSIRSALPTEDEQYEVLKRAAERFHRRKIVLRLLDIGADKQLPYLPLPAARNPSLAQRGIRLLLQHPDILKQQLRAVLRVGAEHAISILLPVVGGVEEVRATREIIEQVRRELAAERKTFGIDTELGAMIEVPSAVLVARSLAREVDFFSLGTNDLVQYLLAADREDESMAPYYQPLHPAVLLAIKLLVDAAAECNRPLTICGDMAGNPRYTELLLGLGLREFSVAPGELLDVKERIRETHLGEARELARAAIELSSTAAIEALLDRSKPTRSAKAP